MLNARFASRFRAAVALLGPLGGLCLLLGCDNHNSGAAAAARDPNDPNARGPAAPVRVAPAVVENVPIRVSAIGWVEAYASVTIRPQVEGQLIEVHFEEGQRLAAGDPLFTIDRRPFEAALHQAEATLAQDTALAEDAQREAVRTEDLYSRNIASDRERDTARARAAATAAQVKADEAAVELAKLRLSYCDIHTPIDGIAGARLVHAGNIVKANETELAVINRIKPIYVRFSVAEQHLTAIRGEMAKAPLTVQVRAPDGDEGFGAGELTFVDNEVDAATGMIRLKATFANDDGHLWPGQFLNVTLTLGVLPDALLIPSVAVQTGQKGQFVFVASGAEPHAELRWIRTGLNLEGRVVVTAGLTAGERVVTAGQARLAPGARIIPQEAAPSTQESGS